MNHVVFFLSVFELLLKEREAKDGFSIARIKT